MRTRILGLALAVCLLAPITASAQDQSAVVRQVIARLQSQGADLSGACGAFRITNQVALELHDLNYRLLRKSGGWRAVPQSNGTCLDGDHASGPGYATDYLISVNEGFVGYDLLGDGGGTNTPQWLGPENDIELVKRNLANNAEPLGLTSAPPPAPTPAPTPTPQPMPVPQPPVVSSEVPSLLQQIIALQQSQLEVILRVDQTTRSTNDHVVAMDRTLTQTLGSISKFVGKYIAPAIAGYLTAKQLH